MFEPLELLGVFAVAFALSIVLTPVARGVARRAGLVDYPDGRRKLHERVVPVAGGPVILFALIGAVSIWLLLGQHSIPVERLRGLLGLCLGAVLICAVGVVDDCALIRGRHKLLGQFAAVGIVVIFGVHIERLRLFGMGLELGLLSLPFTVFFLLGAINSLNLLDGMDGLLSTVGLIIAVALGVMAWHMGNTTAALVSLALAGSLLGFLCFNFPPASIFLGDSGSMVIGLTVGVLAIQGSLKGPATLALAAPAALLILPILDTSAAILRRTLTGRSVYTTDRGHLHHCLLRRGLSTRLVLLMIAAMGLLGVGGALGSVAFNNEWYAALSALVVVGILIASRLFGHAEFLLVGQRVNRMVRSFFRGPGPNEPREMEVRLQGTMDWNCLWQTILEKAVGLDFRRVRLDVNAPALNESYHARWEVGQDLDEEPELWRAEVPLSANGQVIGSLEVVGHAKGDSIAERMTALARLVGCFEASAARLTREAAAPPIILPDTALLGLALAADVETVGTKIHRNGRSLHGAR